VPTQLFKYNGAKWIQVDKNQSDQYAYNNSYIDYLISKIDNGEYDADLLTETEIEQIEKRLKKQYNL